MASNISVGHHRPSDEPIEEYNDLLAIANLYVDAAENRRFSGVPSGQLTSQAPAAASVVTLSRPAPPGTISYAVEHNRPPSPDVISIASVSPPLQQSSKKGLLRTMSDFFTKSSRPETSTPYDPVHLTHIGFNSSTGEFTGLPKEWQQLLSESGIHEIEQKRDPQAVMDVVKFHQGQRDTSLREGTVVSVQYAHGDPLDSVTEEDSVAREDSSGTSRRELSGAPNMGTQHIDPQNEPSAPSSVTLPTAALPDMNAFMTPRQQIDKEVEGIAAEEECRQASRKLLQRLPHRKQNVPMTIRTRKEEHSGTSSPISEKDAAAADLDVVEALDIYDSSPEGSSQSNIASLPRRFARADVAYGRQRLHIAVVPMPEVQERSRWLCCF